jgi:hypothetical protein
MLYFRVRNFEQFQHYKHRSPPWIRLYSQLLHDRRFFRLDDSSKWVVVGVFLLASQHENKIAFDPEWISRELSLTTVPNWQALIDSEFIIPIDCDASTLLASCTQSASQSRADNTEQIIQKTETEILSLSQKSAKVSARESSEIFKFWNQQSATMHHRAIDGQERAICHSLRKFDPAEIRRAIERYSQVRANESGCYRDLYAWTLGEFLSRKDGFNIVRFNAENWEDPFRSNNNGHKSDPEPEGPGRKGYHLEMEPGSVSKAIWVKNANPAEAR